MKKLLTLILVMVLALSLFACKGKDPEPTPTPDPVIEWNVEDAKAYLESYYEDEKTVTPVDYELLAQIIIGDATYTVEWTVEGTDKVTVSAADGKVTVNLDEKSPEEVTYTLKATIKAGDNTTATYTRTCTVPKYDVISFEDYMKAEKDDVVTVAGVVVAINSKSKGNTRNHLFLADTEVEGGYYIYQMETDPLSIGIEIGMTVSVTGPVAPYSGMQEIKGGEAIIIDENKKEVAPLDITSKFAAGESLKNYVGLPVTIKGVTIGKQELGGTSDYLYFSLGEKEAYLRSYLTDFPTTLEIVTDDNGVAVSSPDKTAIEAAHAEKFGWTANVTGILVLYNSNPYLIPTSVDCFEYLELIEKTDAEKVEIELENAKIDASFNEDKVLDLLLAGQYYSEVTLAWTSNSECAVIANGKLTLTIPEEPTTVTITLTATCGEASGTKTFTVKLSKSLTSIKEAVEIGAAMNKDSYTEEKYLIAGVITNIANTQFGNCYITDAEGNTIYIYGLYDAEGNKYDKMTNQPQVGDYITVQSVIGKYNDPQLKNATVLSVVKPITIPEASEIGAAQTGDYTTEKYLTTGVITEFYKNGTTYGNVYITDADGNTILVYGIYSADGKRYDAMTTKPVVGDTITVYGILGQYQGDPQFKNATLLAHTVAETEEPEDPEDPDTPETPDTPDEPTDGIKLDAENLGLGAYGNGTATVGGVGFEFIEVGSYGDGIQMRDKNDNPSRLWNTTAFGSAIVRIELVYSATKDVTHSNPDAVIFTFGNEAQGATYTTKLSTTEGTKTYVITPDAETYTFFKLEHDLGYTFYWESITIVLADGSTVTPDTPVNPDPEEPETPDTPVTPDPEEPQTPAGPTAMTAAEALAAAPGTKVIVSGTVSDIYYAWDDFYGNMSVYVTDATGTILAFRLETKVKVGDKITVTGELADYNGTNQLAQGCTAVIDEAAPETPVVPDPTPDPEEPETPVDPDPTPDTPTGNEGRIKLTADNLGLDSYGDGTATVGGVGFEFIQVGSYGDGIQMRDKNSNPSRLWNTTAFGSGIVRIELVYSSTKDVTYSNPDSVIFTFGNAAEQATYTTKLSTTAGTKTYTITPNTNTYTFFKLEHDVGYSYYWESITIVLADGSTITPGTPSTPTPDPEPEEPETPDTPEVPVEGTYSYEFTSKVYAENGTEALGDVDWTLAGDGGYWGYDNNNGRGQQFGSSKKAYKSMTLTSESFTGVTKIVINTSGASATNAVLIITVGGVEVKTITLTKTATEYTVELDSALSGEIEFSYTQTAGAAIYIKSIEVFCA